MPSFRNLIFAKNAVNSFGSFRKGDRAQGRFPKALIDSYLAHGVLAVADEPVALDEPVKDYTPPRARRKKAN